MSLEMSSSTTGLRVLLVGSERARRVFEDCLPRPSHRDAVQVDWVEFLASAVHSVEPADCVVLWTAGDDRDPVRELGDLISMAPGIPAIVVTDVCERELGLNMLRRGAQDHLVAQDLARGALLLAITSAVARGSFHDRSDHSESRYRSIVEALGEGVVVQSNDGTILFANGRATAIIGIAESQALGRRSTDSQWAPINERGRVLEPDERPGYRCMQSALPVQDVVLGVVLPDGTKRWLNTSCYPLRHRGEAFPHGVVSVIRDVTVQRAAEESIRFDAQLLNAVGQSVIATDMAGKILYWNRAAEEMFGWSAEEAIGRNIAGGAMIGVDPQPDLVLHTAASETWTGDLWATHRDGTPLAILVTNTPVREPDGRVVGVVSVSTDISERIAAEAANRRLSSIVESSTDAIYGTDLDGLITSWNASATTLFGYSAAEVLGRHVRLLDPDEAATAFDGRDRPSLVRAVADESDGAVDTVRRCKDDSLAEVFLTQSRVLDSDGLPMARSVIARNVGDRKALERALAKDRDRLAAAQRIARLGSLDRDWSGRHVWSAELYRMLGVDPSVSPTDETYLAAVHDEDRAKVLAAIDDAYRDLLPMHIEHRISIDGSTRWVSAHIGHSSEGNDVGAVLDITERKLAQDELTYRSHHDPLTGLPNRTLFEQRLAERIEDSTRNPDVVMFLDIDRFKIINDGMGHAAGDTLLIEIAKRLKAWAQPSDVVARFGGDEFVILCERGASMTEARRRADAVVDLCAQGFAIGQREIFVTVSVGLVSVADCVGVEEVLSEADAAMYEAKDRGRSRVVVADEVLRDQAVARLELETDLRRAVDQDEFRLYYQPIVDIDSEKLLGFEALVRWEHPVLGLIAPDQFIGLAEETRLIVPIGRWVLREALSQLARWRAASPSRDVGFMAVNLSTLQLYSEDLSREVSDALHEFVIDPTSLHLEITETSLMDIDRAATTLSSLRAIGVQIELDDFGTGYSSLSYLQRLPIQTVKIDRSFVIGLGDDPQTSSIVASIIGLGGSLGMHVLAEGVETVAQRDELRRLGCERAQGYLWSRPLPAEQLDAFIRAHRWRRDVRAAPALGRGAARPLPLPIAPRSEEVAVMLDSLTERVVRYDRADHRIVYCNRSWAAGHAALPEDLIGQRLDDLLSASETAGLTRQLGLLGPDTPILTDSVPRATPDAEDRWLLWADQLVAGGREVLTVGRDVTEWHHAQLELAASDARFRSLADGSADVVFRFTTTPVPRFTYFSPSVERIIGYSAEALQADLAFFYSIIDHNDRAMVLSAIAGDPIPERFDMRFRHPDGSIVIGEMVITRLTDGLQGVGRDVTEIRRLQAELVSLALRDPLTGLANRRLLDELLIGAIDRSKRSGRDLSVAFLDLDGFKNVNDTFGHETGDRVLNEVVRRMLATVRATDVVARVGGDEFVIVRDAADGDTDNFVDRLDSALGAPIDIGAGLMVRCPASIGRADTSTVGWDPKLLITAADAAMYEVKRVRRSSDIEGNGRRDYDNFDLGDPADPTSDGTTLCATALAS